MSEEKTCVASEDCSVQTPHGMVKGKSCPIGDKAYHNTIVDRAIEIEKAKALKVGQHPGALGEDVLSLSGCPTQPYGGNVKFILKSNKDMKPMCYYKWEENKEVDHGIEKEAMTEADGPVGANRVRGKYGVNISMYDRECEHVSHKDIPLKKNLEKIEYWIPWKIEKYSFDHGCKGHYPGYANVNGDEQGIRVMKENIETVKAIAKKLEVPFEVKSCFSALKASWGERYIPLTEETLKKFAEGITPEVVGSGSLDRSKIPDKCKC